MSEIANLWCLIIDDEQNPVDGCFRVQLPLDACAEDLKLKAKEEKATVLAGVDSARLKVWKLTHPKRVEESEKEQVVRGKLIQGVQLIEEEDVARANDPPAAWSLTPACGLSNGTDLNSDELSFLVQMPAAPGTLRSLY
jgi:hypothetical protein